MKKQMVVYMRSALGKIFFIMQVAAAMYCLESCKGQPKEQPSGKPFCISDTMLKNLTLDTARLVTVENEISLSGKVTFDESKVIKVYPMAGGIIHEVKAELGDYVKKGQVLASIQSSDIANLEKELDVAVSNLSIADKNLDVAREFYKNGFGTEKEFITAQKEYQKAQSELTRIKEVLNLFGKSDKTSNYSVRAPISGFIVEKDINEDMQIRADYSEKLFTISELDPVWIIANVYESDISRIREGYEVTVTTLSYPDKVFKGKIDKIFNVLDPRERVMKVRVKLDNPGYLLKPEMFATVVVRFTDDGRKRVAIPSSSVIFDNNRNYVMIYNSQCSVETREVTIHKAGKRFTYIEDGIREGERVISKAQLYIYDALND